MDTTPAASKKNIPWKIIFITLLILGTVITTVILVRKNKKKTMIEKIKASGSSLTDKLLESMSYSDLKKLAEATGADKIDL